MNDWIRFFDALAFLNDGGRREIFCDFAGEYLVISKTPFKKKSAPSQIEKAKARKTKPGPTPARKKKGARAI
jgi:hypothetical protein